MLTTRFAKDYSTSTENRQAVIGSKIVAKAVVMMPGGGCEIIVVFSESTRQEFYWVFRARSPRSARRSWKYARHHQRDFAFDQKPYRDFGSFVEWTARCMGSQIVSVRIHHKRWLARLQVRAAHESIYGNWVPQDPARIRTDKLQRRALAARRGIAW